MKERDKIKIKEAWLKAVDLNPMADSPVIGMSTGDGNSMTLRELVNKIVNDDSTYKNWDELIEKGETTLDEIIEDFSRQGPQ